MPHPPKTDSDESTSEVASQARGPVPHSPPLWARLLNHQLTAVVTGLVLTWVLGTVLSDRITRERTQARERAESARTLAETGLTAVRGFALLMDERRARAELLLSALRRDLDVVELKTRSAAYVQAYADWEKHRQATLVTLRCVTDAPIKSPYEDPFRYLNQAHRIVDQQLTAAYDRRLRGMRAGDLALADSALRVSGRCGAAIVGELYEMVVRRELAPEGRTCAASQGGQAAAVTQRLQAECVPDPTWPIVKPEAP